MEHLSNDHEDCPNQHENIHKPHDKMGHPAVIFTENLWKQTTRWSEFPNGKKAIVEQILPSEGRNSKEQDFESQSGIQVGKLTICVRTFEIKHQVNQFHQNSLASPYDGH